MTVGFTEDFLVSYPVVSFSTFFFLTNPKKNSKAKNTLANSVGQTHFQKLNVKKNKNKNKKSNCWKSKNETKNTRTISETKQQKATTQQQIWEDGSCYRNGTTIHKTK